MRKAWGAVALASVVVLVLSGCQGGGNAGSVTASGAALTSPSGTPAGPSSGSPGSPGASSPTSVTPTPSGPVSVSFSPAKGATKVRPDQQVQVTASNATLASVQVRSAGGSVLAGELDAGGSVWRSTGVLAAGTAYTVSAQTRAGGGTGGTFTSGFSTLRPASTTSAVILPGDDWVVGVGMPVIVQFGRSVSNRAAAVKTLRVDTTPQVEGAWHWMNSESVWWRPREFWPAGTKVKVTAAIEGAELAPGRWGRRTYTSSFSVGSSVISTVDIARHTLTVTKDGKLVKVIPVTTGKDDPRFRTRNGTKVIMDKQESVRMNAATLGTDPGDPDFYDTVAHWAMRLTWSGEFLHARPGSEWAFGKRNVSHGCTGMSTANARWLFEFSKIGDVVTYVGGKRELEFGNGYTAWDLPYEKWSSTPAPS